MAAVSRQALDRRDEASLALGDGDETTADRLAVDVDGAGAAIAGAAAIFGAGQVRRIAQRPQQRRFGVHAIFDRPVVDREFRHAIRNSETARLVTPRSEEHTSELRSLMRISYAVLCLKK